MNNTIAILMFLMNNMEKIYEEGIIVVDIIEDIMAHPHYHSRTVFEVYYDPDEHCFMSDLGCSGSPSAWNHYEDPIYSWIELAEQIDYYIETAKREEKNDKNSVEYLKIE